MYDKAVLFGDYEVAEKILKTTSPMKIKQLGRQVKGFKDKTWKKHRLDSMYRHCFAKFSQNEHLKEALLRTGNKQMVEASPSDRVWGIGLNEDVARRRAPDTWPGQNLLGQVLNNVREELRRQGENGDEETTEEAKQVGEVKEDSKEEEDSDEEGHVYY